ncbi:hypothetical protein ACFRAQ_24380 [Nocardia sp. NPDC056611]|uniref:hypothetical protein n=1 Tax=Nocardia sp. NPDC056611 TaxID=3345877 RepID=UPI00366FA133
MPLMEYRVDACESVFDRVLRGDAACFKLFEMLVGLDQFTAESAAFLITALEYLVDTLPKGFFGSGLS